MEHLEAADEGKSADSVGARDRRELVRQRLPIAGGVTLGVGLLLIFVSDLSVFDSDTLRGFLEDLWASIRGRGRDETLIGLVIIGATGVGAVVWAAWPIAHTARARAMIAGLGVILVGGLALLIFAQKSGVVEQPIAGVVNGPEEAFCAGFVSTLVETDSALVPELEALGTPSVSECLEEGLPETLGVTPEADEKNAYAFGCALVIANLQEGAGLFDDETMFDLAFSICFRPFDAFDPENFGLEPVITRDGLCYPGYGPGAGVQGCVDETGEYVTTTTVSFTGDAGRNSAVLDAARDAFGNTLVGIGGETEVLGLASRVCDLYESGYGYEFIDEVADLRDNAVAWPGVAPEDLARFKAAAWEFTADVVAELCPEHGDEAAVDRGEFAGTVWEPSAFGFGGTLGYAFDGIETTDPDGWGHHYGVYRDFGRDVWVDFGVEVCHDLDRGSGYGSVREAVLDVLRSDGSGETEADAFFGYQIASAITYDLCPRHYRRFHDFEQP